MHKTSSQMGNFNAANTGWVFFDPAVAVEAYLTETTYGGTAATNYVAEIDFGANLRRTGITVTAGETYHLSFRHTLRTGGTPNPVTINVKIYDGATVF